VAPISYPEKAPTASKSIRPRPGKRVPMECVVAFPSRVPGEQPPPPRDPRRAPENPGSIHEGGLRAMAILLGGSVWRASRTTRNLIVACVVGGRRGPESARSAASWQLHCLSLSGFGTELWLPSLISTVQIADFPKKNHLGTLQRSRDGGAKRQHLCQVESRAIC